MHLLSSYIIIPLVAVFAGNCHAVLDSAGGSQGSSIRGSRTLVDDRKGDPRFSPPSVFVIEDEAFYASLVDMQSMSMQTPDPTSAPVVPTPRPSEQPSELPTIPPSTTSPTVAPTESPTQSPSSNPTVPPSAPPTPGLTEPPSASPTPGPTEPPSVPPTPGQTEPPSASPTPGPTESPSASPTPGPTETPTDSPTQGPTESPTDSPTPGPTQSPSASPTLGPTGSPTDTPTTTPTVSPTAPLTEPPTTDSPTDSPTEPPTSSPTGSPTVAPTPRPACEIDILINCFDDDGNECAGLIPEPVICEERPTRLVMAFRGGDCSQSSNIQPDNLFQCFDFGEGPPMEGQVYIRATDSQGLGFVYFEGAVDIGSNYTLFREGERLQADTSILVSEGTEPGGTPLQLVNFHTSCARNLFLRDYYGANQVVGWTNDVQGVVNSFLPVSYAYFIENIGTIDAELLSLFSTINGNLLDLSETVENQILSPGGVILSSSNDFLDLSVRRTYTANATVTAQPQGGAQCTDTDRLVFEAGPFRPGAPTDAPMVTNAPTSSPAPTTEPQSTLCELQAFVACTLANGVPCSILTRVPSQDLTCTVEEPTEFGWFYTAGSCADSTTSQSFMCTDTNGGPASAEEVFISIVGSSGTRYFGGVATTGQFIAIADASGGSIDEELMVTIATNGDSPRDTTLQTMMFRTACDESDDLTLGRSFGALEFASYRSDDAFVQGFEAVEWTFTIINVGAPDAELVNSTATINDEEIIVVPPNLPERIILETGESFDSVVEDVINLTVPSEYNALLLVVARAVGGIGCGAAGFESFAVI